METRPGLAFGRHRGRVAVAIAVQFERPVRAFTLRSTSSATAVSPPAASIAPMVPTSHAMLKLNTTRVSPATIAGTATQRL